MKTYKKKKKRERELPEFDLYLLLESLNVVDCQTDHEVDQDDTGEHGEDEEHDSACDRQERNPAVLGSAEQLLVLVFTHHHYHGPHDGSPEIAELVVPVEQNGEAQRESDNQVAERQENLKGSKKLRIHVVIIARVVRGEGITMGCVSSTRRDFQSPYICLLSVFQPCSWLKSSS